MSIGDAVKLVLKSCTLAKGGEIFILKMPSVRIKDLIEVVIEELAPKYGYNPEDIKIEIIGKRPGEKLYEELLIEGENCNLEELEDMLFGIALEKAEDSEIISQEEGLKKLGLI